MNYTDEQLRLCLAKMLPEKVVIQRDLNNYDFRWNDSEEHGTYHPRVSRREWLHVCWLVEQTLSDYSGDEGQEYSQQDDYACELLKQVATYKENFRWGSECADFYKIANAPWQQRAIALAKVKGIEIV